nr:hypothetical protein Iba_chr07fCG7020 [Ipomoea batatas]GMD20675.1 hypothetical protein Iba_chr07fCG7040 [Ipomoea batatas]
MPQGKYGAKTLHTRSAILNPSANLPHPPAPASASDQVTNTRRFPGEIDIKLIEISVLD